MDKILHKLFFFLAISFCFVSATGCTIAQYHKISLPEIGERKNDSGQHRINLGDLFIHVQPRNEVKYNETSYVSVLPVDTKDFNKRLTRKWPPLIVDFYVYTENDSYSFLPKEIKLSVNGQRAIRPSDISGPHDYSEHISDWSRSINKTLGRISCKTNFTKGVVPQGIDTEIELNENNWLCYKLHYNIVVPWPTDKIVITVEGIKKNGEELIIPPISYKEGNYTRLNY